MPLNLFLLRHRLQPLRYPKSAAIVGVAALALLLPGCSQIKKAIFPTAQSTAATLPATAAQHALAQHLAKTGAKLYGTYWCPFCTRQKELFAAALKELPSIECDPKGENAQPQACAAANISSFPTWEINGKQYRGMRSLEELAVLSNYKGSLDFNN